MNYFPSDLKKIDGLKEINLKDFICNTNLRRGAMIASGGYAGQNFYSILASKVYDIEQKGFCFWAHRYFTSKEALNFSTKFFDSEGTKFLLMTYTHDNAYAIDDSFSIQEKESINEYYLRMWNSVKNGNDISYVKKYKDTNNTDWLQYPAEMFPELIFNNDNGKSSVAYLISEFNYLTENITMKDMCTFFKQKTISCAQWSACNYCNRPNHRWVELKDNQDITRLLNNIEKTDKITYVLAKLKWPYVVQLR